MNQRRGNPEVIPQLSCHCETIPMKSEGEAIWAERNPSTQIATGFALAMTPARIAFSPL
ncbi:MAG: hypothetical protein Q8O55_12330 [Dehalococcoidales bacterium]|nr:hypothetical protein [Dehalococcoidales bacterium]